MTIIVASPFCNDQLLNNLGFLVILLACLATGINNVIRALKKEQSILSYADQL